MELLITTCQNCKKVIDRKEMEYSACGVTSGICDDCKIKHYPEIFTASLDQGTTHSTQEMESDLTGECG